MVFGVYCGPTVILVELEGSGIERIWWLWGAIKGRLRGSLRGLAYRGLAYGGPRPEKHELFFGVDVPAQRRIVSVEYGAIMERS